MAELEDLTAFVVALEQRITDLEGELARVRAGRIRPMSETHRCPACGGGHLLRVKASEMKEGSVVPLVLHHEKRFLGHTFQGPIEYFVCCNCKLIESHAIDLEGVVPDGEEIVEIHPEPEPDPAGGPFR